MPGYVGARGELYPIPGDVLVHKTSGIIGTFRSEASVNRGRKHFYVQILRNTSYIMLCLPATDWRFATAEEIKDGKSILDAPESQVP